LKRKEIYLQKPKDYKLKDQNQKEIDDPTNKKRTLIIFAWRSLAPVAHLKGVSRKNLARISLLVVPLLLL